MNIQGVPVERVACSDPVLVLGGNGRLGRILHMRWANRPDVFWQARGPVAGIRWAPGVPWPGPARVHAIVALWGVVPGCGDPAANVPLACAAMALGAALGAERVLHCSSAAVYAPAPLPRNETQTDPRSAYGKAKLAMEQAIAAWQTANPHGPAACVLRIGNVAGADSAFAAIRHRGPVRVDRFAGGHGPRRSYLDHATLARVIDALLTCPNMALPGVVNVANDGVIDMADLVRAAGRQLVWTPAKTPQAGTVLLDLTRLRQLVDPGPTDPATLLADAATLFRGQR